MATSGTQRRARFPVLEIVGVAMLLVATILLVVNLAGFSDDRQKMPQGVLMGGVPVGGLSRSQAQAHVEEVYGSPVTVFYRDQEIRLSPGQIGLAVNSSAMLSRADEMRTEGTFWSGFWDFLWMRPERASDVDLVVDYSPDLLRAWLADVAARYDRPPQPAQPVLETLSFQAGQPGYTLDQAASFQLLDAALRRPTNRTVELVVNENTAPRPDLETLKALIVQYLISKQFKGVSSNYVIDLKTGDEMRLDVDLRQGSPSYVSCDIAYAGQSTMKIAIMADFFRYLGGIPPEDSDEYKILSETMILSGDISANFILQDIGLGDPYKGATSVTEMMQQLGMKNSFIAVPYFDNTPPSQHYYTTPAYDAARNGTCINTLPDYAMQTTAPDLAIMMDTIYQCAEYGGGGLIAAYPDRITPAECQAMIDLMAKNPDGIIMAGLPEDVKIAHKHGWGAGDTYTDAAIVFSPGGDYVITSILWGDTAWLPATVAFPIIRDISAMTFNYFNPDLINAPRRPYNPDLGVPNP